MAEKVLIRAPGSSAPPRSVDARLAQYLVYRGRAEYVEASGDRSTYVVATDRQSAAAEVDVEFRPSDALDVKPKAKKKAAKKGTYKRRDMKAEE